MGDLLRVSLVQGDTRWHDPSGNREYYGELIAPLQGQTDVVILPETFTSGFSNDAIDQAEGVNGPTVDWLKEQARKLDAAVTGSVQVRTDHGVFNRMYFVTPDGGVKHYDKRHLFRYGREHERYAPGKDRIIVDFRGWKICPLVCYDLRFPVFSRNGYDASTQQSDYDLVIYTANWPAVRRYPWVQLAKARAIENLAYVASVNRVGTDGNNLEYSGDSAVYDFKGMPVVETTEYREEVVTAAISKSALNEFREMFPAMLDADAFDLR